MCRSRAMPNILVGLENSVVLLLRQKKKKKKKNNKKNDKPIHV